MLPSYFCGDAASTSRMAVAVAGELTTRPQPFLKTTFRFISPCGHRVVASIVIALPVSDNRHGVRSISERWLWGSWRESPL